MSWERNLTASRKICSLETFWGWQSVDHACWNVTEAWGFNIGKTIGSHGLDTTSLNSWTFLLVTFLSQFIRTRFHWRMTITCRIFKRSHHEFTTTHDRGASQSNWAPIFPCWKAVSILFSRHRRLNLGFEFLNLPPFWLFTKKYYRPPPPLHDQNFRLIGWLPLFLELLHHTLNFTSQFIWYRLFRA